MRPRVITVFMNTMQTRSARDAPPSTAPAVLPTAWDSPVSAASATSAPCACSTLASAGTRSPASSSRISPGTSSSAGTTRVSRSRRTRALGASMPRKAASAFSARRSWKKPSVALSRTTTAMTAASLMSPISPASSAAPIRIPISTLLNWSRNLSHAGRGGFSASRFGPWRCSRTATSVCSKPVSGATSSLRQTALSGIACQGTTEGRVFVSKFDSTETTKGLFPKDTDPCMLSLHGPCPRARSRL